MKFFRTKTDEIFVCPYEGTQPKDSVRLQVLPLDDWDRIVELITEMRNDWDNAKFVIDEDDYKELMKLLENNAE